MPLPDLIKSVILKVDELTAYREMFEANASKGDQRETISVYHKQFNNKEAPEDINELLAGIPSATELFIRMLNEMKENNTRKLIVDLSKNTGGSSLMSEILVYLIYGQDALVEIIKSSSVKKISPYLLESQPNKTLDAMNAEYSRIQNYRLTENDYDFSYEKYIQMATSGMIDIKTGLGIKYGKVPTFMKEIMSGENSGLYTPGEVIVASSHNTFSSAFTFMLNLKKCGAKVAGSTSGQSGNGFGNLLLVSLKHSNIRLAISKDAYKAFPEKERERKVLEPDFLLAYKKLMEYDFDTNSELRLAMEILDIK